MPRKKDIYSSYGQKLISLFAKLLFTGESHSLTDLSRMLGCSKHAYPVDTYAPLASCSATDVGLA